jgi:hypothetical protein
LQSVTSPWHLQEVGAAQTGTMVVVVDAVLVSQLGGGLLVALALGADDVGEDAAGEAQILGFLLDGAPGGVPGEYFGDLGVGYAAGFAECAVAFAAV